METSTITLCYEEKRIKTKTHVGVRPWGINRIHQAQAELSGSSVAWLSSRIDNTWCPYNMDIPSEGGT